MPNAAKTLALLFALLTFAAAAPAKDDGHDKDRAAIKAAYAAMEKAFANKDANGFMAYMAPNYAEINLQGKNVAYGKAEQLAKCREAFATMTMLSAHMIITNITFDKRGASMTNAAEGRFTETRNGVAHTHSEKSTSRDLWVKSGSSWLLKRSTVTAEHATIDGKPVK